MIKQNDETRQFYTDTCKQSCVIVNSHIFKIESRNYSPDNARQDNSLG